MDTIGRKPESRQRLNAGAVLEALAQGQAEPASAVGLGEEYRLSTPGLAGATLVAHGRVAHLMAFPTTVTPEVNQ
jgi:hypothetical protein